MFLANNENNLPCSSHSAFLYLMRLLQVQADQAAPMTTSFVKQEQSILQYLSSYFFTSTFLASGWKTFALPTTVRLFCARLIATQSRRGLEAKPMLFAWLLLAMKVSWMPKSVRKCLKMHQSTCPAELCISHIIIV